MKVLAVIAAVSILFSCSCLYCSAAVIGYEPYIEYTAAGLLENSNDVYLGSDGCLYSSAVSSSTGEPISKRVVNANWLDGADYKIVVDGNLAGVYVYTETSTTGRVTVYDEYVGPIYSYQIYAYPESQGKGLRSVTLYHATEYPMGYMPQSVNWMLGGVRNVILIVFNDSVLSLGLALWAIGGGIFLFKKIRS